MRLPYLKLNFKQLPGITVAARYRFLCFWNFETIRISGILGISGIIGILENFRHFRHF
jgi:hypothetical protein